VVPIGFFSGGFTSTSSLRSGQRGSTEVERRSLPRRLITPSERHRVFIRVAREAPVGIFLAQTFRPRPGRQWQRLLPLVAVLRLKRFRPNLPIPSPVTTAVTIATGAGLYAHVPRLSRLFFKKILERISLVFLGFSSYLKSSSTGNFHRWKIHQRFVEIFSTFLSNRIKMGDSFVVFAFALFKAAALASGTWRARGCDFSAPSFIIALSETHQIIRIA
jgi:hypothetical protein